MHGHVRLAARGSSGVESPVKSVPHRTRAAHQLACPLPIPALARPHALRGSRSPDARRRNRRHRPGQEAKRSFRLTRRNPGANRSCPRSCTRYRIRLQLPVVRRKHRLNTKRRARQSTPLTTGKLQTKILLLLQCNPYKKVSHVPPIRQANKPPTNEATSRRARQCRPSPAHSRDR
jgi:hypothetical protein